MTWRRVAVVATVATFAAGAGMASTARAFDPSELDQNGPTEGLQQIGPTEGDQSAPNSQFEPSCAGRCARKKRRRSRAT